MKKFRKNFAIFMFFIFSKIIKKKFRENFHFYIKLKIYISDKAIANKPMNCLRFSFSTHLLGNYVSDERRAS